MCRGGLPLAGVCGLAPEHAAGVSDYRDLSPLAAEMVTPFLGFEKVTDSGVFSFLKEVSPDWLFVIGLSQLVPAGLRGLARAGAVGFHPTPLPEGRGRAPVAWTILLDRPAAANLFFLTDEPDAGDIIEQRPVPVRPDDYAADLIARTNDVLETMLADLSPAFASGQVPRRPQDHAKATYYPRRRPEEGRIDWNQPVEAIYRFIRAVSHPYPGAFSYYDGAKILIWRARPIIDSGPASAPPGTVIGFEQGRPLIQTQSGRLELTDIEWSGAAAPDWRERGVLGA